MDLNWSDLAFLSHELAGSTGKGGVDLQALDQGGWGDKLHLWDFSLESVPSILIEKDLGIELFS